MRTLAHHPTNVRLIVLTITTAGVFLVAAGCGGAGSDTRGTLTGQVTNNLTGSGLSGIDVLIEPAMEGVEMTTDANGLYTAELPVGVYTVMIADERFAPRSEDASIVAGGITVRDLALDPLAAVVVSTALQGDAVPGAVLSAAAEIEVLDNSVVQGIQWTQSNSVAVTLEQANTATATVRLPAVSAYKQELLRVLAEPPIMQDDLPPNVPLPDHEFPAGLQERFELIGLNPFDLEEAGLVVLTVSVTTSSGVYTQDVAIHTELPWRTTSSIHNVPVDVPVLLNGKVQEAYDWQLSGPGGSSAALIDGNTRHPYFTPDVAGRYTLSVTDRTTEPATMVTLEITAGTWQGVITGQDENARPLADNCTVCHNGEIAADVFTAWAQTGHAEIFTNNLDTSTHYGENCFSCHMVGYQPGANNQGAHQASDFGEFLNAGLLNNPGDNWTAMLAQFPETARMANIQCENCHGPQNSVAHTTMDARISLSADVCAVCHGEPLRHARFQQWQLSGHANYELAIEEGGSGSCARCHTVNGFLAWLPVLLDDDPNTNPLDDVMVTWTSDQTHPQTCVTCHDPHDIGTTTGSETNATVRISGNTPQLIAGFQALGVGRGAICMTCHNSRRGLRNDSNFSEIAGTAEAARAPHGSAQTDVLMGHNAYFVQVGVRGNHSLVEDTCVNCHMTQTPPPDVLSYNQGGTNHTFFASADICIKCHGSEFDAAGLQIAFEASSAELKELIHSALLRVMSERFAAGQRIDLAGAQTLTGVGDFAELEFGEASGRQAVTIVLNNGTVLGPYRLNDLVVRDASGAELGQLYDFADERLIKSGWNWNLVNNDGSRGVHNSAFVFQILDQSIAQLNALLREG